jgi:DNA-binding SARP family transcriptional activator
MIQISLFGPTVVVHEDLRLQATELGGVKPRQLLEMLALDLGTPLSKDLLAERLWEGQPPASYIATVESYVCVLRSRANLGSGRRGALATTTCGYMLDPEQVQVDLVEARSMLAMAAVPDVCRALDLVSGELLAGDPYVAWAREERDAFADLLAAACVGAARTANAAGDNLFALRLARAAAERSYLSEPAAQELMTALAQSGERWQALKVYDLLRTSMLDELGVEPGPEITRQYLATLRAEIPADHRPEEIGTLLRLLRRALEGSTDSANDGPDMAEVGRLLLSRCG